MILKVVQGNIQDEPFAAQQIPASFIHGAQYSIPHIKTLLEKKEKDVKIMNALSYYGFARKCSRESVTWNMAKDLADNISTYTWYHLDIFWRPRIYYDSI